jgi:hypothetical protein
MLGMSKDTILVLVNILGVVVVAGINYLSNRTTHKLVNSRMSELLIMAKKNWREGREDEEELHKGKAGSGEPRRE